ncbi:hypothetical protein [Streptomyces sp. NPDC052012]|uniref:hypothetical protein n=1 Tax=Streptomyces sp. NPDC052012 TaxID=3155051 RepID=UPI00344B625F
MTHANATLTRPEPVPVTIGLRPPAETTGALPLPINPPQVADGEFLIITDLDADVAESAGCNCSASDDNPY